MTPNDPLTPELGLSPQELRRYYDIIRARFTVESLIVSVEDFEPTVNAVRAAAEFEAVLAGGVAEDAPDIVSDTAGQPTATVRFGQMAAAELQRLARLALTTGRARQTESALRESLLQLAQEPQTFGTVLFQLPKMKVTIRAAVQHPVYLEYDVQDERMVVTVRHIGFVSSLIR